MNIRSDDQEPFGKRLAYLRNKHGWTQQALANRLAISRVAISQIEMDLVMPSERTVTLLAGIFKLTPHELVEGTLYPQAKVDRLPQVTCCYTQVELELALMENDLEWLKTIQTSQIKGNEPAIPKAAYKTWKKWMERLSLLERSSVDEQERGLIAAALAHLRLAAPN